MHLCMNGHIYMHALTSSVSNIDGTRCWQKHHSRVSGGQREAECLLLLNYIVRGCPYSETYYTAISTEGQAPGHNFVIIWDYKVESEVQINILTERLEKPSKISHVSNYNMCFWKCTYE